MSTLLDRLRGWGCDVDGAMERMGDDEAFYAECLRGVAEDAYFEKLKDALDANDVSGAFDAAHALKGVFANVGLTPMCEQIAALVEPLRAGRCDGLNESYARLIRMRAHLCAVLAEA